VIRVRGLVVEWGGHRILNGVDFDVPKGSVTGITGPCGTGKTVLLKALCGLLPIKEGEAYVAGHRITRDTSPEELAELRKKIGFSFQNFALFDTLTIRRNIAFPLERLGESAEIVAARVDAHLASVGLIEAGDLLPEQLSGGMRRRAAIARATVAHHPLTFHDDPISGLDPVNTSRIIDLLFEIHRADVSSTAVIVSHEDEVLQRLCNRIAVMAKNGRIAEVLDIGGDR